MLPIAERSGALVPKEGQVRAMILTPTLSPTLVTCLPVNYFVSTVAYEIDLRICFIVTLT